MLTCNLNLRQCSAAAAFGQSSKDTAEPIIAKGISCRLRPLLSAGLRFQPGESAINKGIKAERASARSFSCVLFVYVRVFVLAGRPTSHSKRKCVGTQGARTTQEKCRARGSSAWIRTGVLRWTAPTHICRRQHESKQPRRFVSRERPLSPLINWPSVGTLCCLKALAACDAAPLCDRPIEYVPLLCLSPAPDKHAH